MALQSIEKKKAELQRARDAMTNGPSAAKQAIIRVRYGFLAGWLICFALGIVLMMDPLMYFGAGLFVLWLLLVFAGLFVS